MTGWQPIETAPRNGTEVVGYWQYLYPGDKNRTHGACIIIVTPGNNVEDDEDGHFLSYGPYTHWAPIPAVQP
jgi:hypothetical protein